MASDKEKLLKTLKKNLDAIGDALDEKLGATIENIKSLANSFASISKILQSKLKSLDVIVDLENITKKNTAVTLTANSTSEVKSFDYKSSVKIIYTDTFTKDVLKSGDGNDVIDGFLMVPGVPYEWDNGFSLNEIVGYATKSSDALLPANFDEPNNFLSNVTFAQSNNKK